MTVRKLRPMSAAERARRYRVRKAAAEAPIVTPETANVTNITPAVTPPTRAFRAGGVTITGIVLSATGILLAGLGACMTTAYLATGADGVDRLLFGGLALSADVLGLLSPSAGMMLWRGRRRLLGVGAWVLWAMAGAVTVSNIAGFISGHADTLIAGRETALTERALVTERVTRLRDERRHITEHRPVDAIAIAVRNSSRAHIDDERSALAVARRRDAIDTELRVLERSIMEMPAVTTADPSAAVLAGAIASVSDGRVVIAEEAVRRVRLLLLLMLPLTGGLVLAIGLAVMRGLA
jgi:hypothetical protein